ncbi:MAG: 1-acyl-sn-glycerol-3-phosphate acyltransferase, partial [Gemmatimonadota bacterium]|nr:1-acyl-sn-glycerol-3-phosphate acyltransferase [Gemmatimonadota bacterium]
MPWLLPILPPVARAAASVYYRIRYVGEPVPRTGPVLLVANHPNSLLDPMLVVATAGRPVRFLAKAPLFHDPKTAWLVKSAGAIPVYRRADDPSQVEKNVDAFDAVYAELARGAAVGIFPEGLSHSEPALGPLKTGAARMALGAARLTGGAFPIVPVGLVLRRKDEFRSSAYVVTGAPVAWDDLAHRGVDDADAVHAL